MTSFRRLSPRGAPRTDSSTRFWKRSPSCKRREHATHVSRRPWQSHACLRASGLTILRASACSAPSWPSRAPSGQPTLGRRHGARRHASFNGMRAGCSCAASWPRHAPLVRPAVSAPPCACTLGRRCANKQRASCAAPCCGSARRPQRRGPLNLPRVATWPPTRRRSSSVGRRRSRRH